MYIYIYIYIQSRLAGLEKTQLPSLRGEAPRRPAQDARDAGARPSAAWAADGGQDGPAAVEDDWRRAVEMMDHAGSGAVPPDALIPLMFWLSALLYSMLCDAILY